MEYFDPRLIDKELERQDGETPLPLQPEYDMKHRKSDQDQVFYREVWKMKDHRCEECGKDLGHLMRPHFISHTLPKGAYPKLRHLVQNIKILCFDHHQVWEFGKRKEMKVYTEEAMDRLRLTDRKLTEAPWLFLPADFVL